MKYAGFPIYFNAGLGSVPRYVFTACFSWSGAAGSAKR